MRLWHSQYEDVGALLQEALADAERAGSAVVELEVLGMRALVASCWSRRKHADDATQRARTLLAQHAGLTPPPRPGTGLGPPSARGRRPPRPGSGFATATAVRSSGGRSWPSPCPWPWARLAACWPAGSRTRPAACCQEAGRQTPPGLAVQRDVMLAQLDISLGRPRAALSLLQDHQGREVAVTAAVTRARAYLALNDLDRAQTCVRGVLTASSSQVGRYLLVEAFLLRSADRAATSRPGPRAGRDPARHRNRRRRYRPALLGDGHGVHRAAGPSPHGGGSVAGAAPGRGRTTAPRAGAAGRGSAGGANG